MIVVGRTPGLAVTTQLRRYKPVLMASTIHAKEPKDVDGQEGQCTNLSIKTCSNQSTMKT